MTDPIDPASNLAEIRAEIDAAATDAGRDPDTINIVAVSKVHNRTRIEPALKAGHRLFGENRVQEAEDKWPSLKDAYPGTILHLIGPLQSNKVKNAVAVFDVIETVDRPKIARALAKEFDRVGRRLPCFVQVNTGEEPQKSGILPEDVDDFIGLCRTELELDVRGLMCIPPVDEEASLHFALLAKMAERNGLDGLSMGMSADYLKAVPFGATHVRIGSAIFGTRPA